MSRFKWRLWRGRYTSSKREKQKFCEREGESKSRELASRTRIRGGLTIRLISRVCGSLLAPGQEGFHLPFLLLYSFSASTRSTLISFLGTLSLFYQLGIIAKILPWVRWRDLEEEFQSNIISRRVWRVRFRKLNLSRDMISIASVSMCAKLHEVSLRFVNMFSYIFFIPLRNVNVVDNVYAHDYDAAVPVLCLANESLRRPRLSLLDRSRRSFVLFFTSEISNHPLVCSLSISPSFPSSFPPFILFYFTFHCFVLHFAWYISFSPRYSSSFSLSFSLPCLWYIFN